MHLRITYTTWRDSSKQSYAEFNESSPGEDPLHRPGIIESAAG